MKKKILKFLKWTFFLVIIVAIGAGLFFFNKHLREEKLFIYKNGTDKKAILNSTWNMLWKEIERANQCKLKDGLTFTFFEPGLNALLDEKRITAKQIDEINLWTYSAELDYDFFDDRLFRYRLLGKVYEPNEFDSVAIKNLSLSYGTFIKDSTQYCGKFFKDSISVEYRQFDMDSKEQEKEHRFLIEVTYLPTFNEIVRTAEKEQQSIFH